MREREKKTFTIISDCCRILSPQHGRLFLSCVSWDKTFCFLFLKTKFRNQMVDLFCETLIAVLQLLLVCNEYVSSKEYKMLK